MNIEAPERTESTATGPVGHGESLTAKARIECRLKPGTRRRWLWHVLLIGFVLATRFPLVGNFEGEPDSCRYLTGLHLWVSGDRTNHLIYARAMSSGYYWLGAHLANAGHFSVQDYSLLLSIVSLCAALLLAPVVYGLSRWVTNDDTGFLCTLVFLTCPAVWWTGIEPHPQALSMLLGLFSLYGFYRGFVFASSWPWIVFSTLSLAAGLLVKIDTLLLYPGFYGLLLFRDGLGKHTIVRLTKATGILAAALALFLVGRTILLGADSHQIQTETNDVLRSFLILPVGLSIVKQAMPVVMAMGPLLFLFAVSGAGVFVWRASSEDRVRWLTLLGVWMLPGCLFWFFIMGNVPRHVAVFTLPLVWLALRGASHCFSHRVTALAVVAVVLLNFFSVPANSSPSHLLSPNVPTSAMFLREREKEIRAVAREAAERGGDACFLGSYTTAYFRFYLLQATADLRPTLGQEKNLVSWVRSSRYSITCGDPTNLMISSQTPQAQNFGTACAHSYSLEFRPDGSKARFFGREVYTSRLWEKIAVAAGGSR